MKRTVYFIGTDEAGYGPTLGPLLVSASCWRMTLGEEVTAPPKKNGADSPPSLFDHLSDDDAFDFSGESERATSAGVSPDDDVLFGLAPERLSVILADFCAMGGVFPVVDSKKLYHQGRMAPLERSLLLALFLLTTTGRMDSVVSDSDDDFRDGLTFRQLVSFLTARSASEDAAGIPPWERDDSGKDALIDFSLPVSSKSGNVAELAATAKKIAEAFFDRGVEILDLRSRRIHPAEFNRLLGDDGLKSDLLADVTLGLAAGLVADIERREAIGREKKRGRANPLSTRIFLLGDKLGGRNRYADTLRRFFPDRKIRPLVESRYLSRYRITAGETGENSEEIRPIPIEIRFQAKGESNLPTALASMADKYLRELSMIPFNEFWRRSLPDLRPTAGYPEDARRFLAEIADLQRKQGIADEILRRKK